MNSSSTPKRSRGPYRSLGRRTPRQTLHNRKRRRNTNGTTQSTVPLLEATVDDEEMFLETDSQQDEDGVLDELAADGCDALSLPVSADRSFSSPLLQLFPDSLLTPSTSHLLISIFANRHQLSCQAKEDLLRLLQLHPSQ